jgi:hypothetical protein
VTTTASASTVAGSKSVPEQRRSSAIASSTGRAARYERSVVIALNASHVRTIRATGVLVLMLPLAALLGVFARERQVRIDHALELSSAYRGTAFLLGDVVTAYVRIRIPTGGREVFALNVSLALVAAVRSASPPLTAGL